MSYFWVKITGRRKASNNALFTDRPDCISSGLGLSAALVRLRSQASETETTLQSHVLICAVSGELNACVLL